MRIDVARNSSTFVLARQTGCGITFPEGLAGGTGPRGDIPALQPRLRVREGTSSLWTRAVVTHGDKFVWSFERFRREHLEPVVLLSSRRPVTFPKGDIFREPLAHFLF